MIESLHPCNKATTSIGNHPLSPYGNTPISKVSNIKLWNTNKSNSNENLFLLSLVIKNKIKMTELPQWFSISLSNLLLRWAIQQGSLLANMIFSW